MSKIKKGDEVVVLTGRDKGRRGNVTRVLVGEGRVIVEGINLVKKHQKGNPNAGEPGGIIEKEMSLDLSNVGLWNAAKNNGEGGPDRVGYKFLGEGEARRKVRYFKSTDEVVDA